MITEEMEQLMTKKEENNKQKEWLVEEEFERLYQRLELRVLARYTRRNDFKLKRLYEFLNYLTTYDILSLDEKERLFSEFIDRHWQRFTKKELPTNYPTIRLAYEEEDSHIYFHSTKDTVNQIIELLATSNGYIQYDERLSSWDVDNSSNHIENIHAAVERLKKVERHLDIAEHLNERIEAFKHDAPKQFLEDNYENKKLYKQGSLLYEELGHMF